MHSIKLVPISYTCLFTTLNSLWHQTHWCKRNITHLSFDWTGVCLVWIDYFMSSWTIEFLYFSKCDMWWLLDFEFSISELYQWKHFQYGDAISNLKCIPALYLFWTLTSLSCVSLYKCLYVDYWNVAKSGLAGYEGGENVYFFLNLIKKKKKSSPGVSGAILDSLWAWHSVGVKGI